MDNLTDKKYSKLSIVVFILMIFSVPDGALHGESQLRDSRSVEARG